MLRWDKYNFTAFLGNYDKVTDWPTDERTIPPIIQPTDEQAGFIWKLHFQKFNSGTNPFLAVDRNTK